MKERAIPPVVAAVHDLSCYGRCALTVVLPLLSAMGLQAVPLPTALLSTHTGGYSDFTFLDLHDEMRKIITHWEKLGLRFDAVYSGFLGSDAQCATVGDLLGHFRPQTALVDPVLGDDGALYQTISSSHLDAMRTLCARADVITPNLTESCFLLGEPYPDREPGEEEISRLARALSALGPRRVVITGIPTSRDGGEMMTTVSLDGGVLSLLSLPRLPRRYPGTGDIFASVLLGMLLRGEKLAAAAERASRFVWRVMDSTARADSRPQSGGIADNREGVCFEPYLASLAPDRGDDGDNSGKKDEKPS